MSYNSNSPIEDLSNKVWVGKRLQGGGLQKVDLGNALRRRMPLDVGRFATTKDIATPRGTRPHWELDLGWLLIWNHWVNPLL